MEKIGALSFGRYLKTIRIQRGNRLEEISEATKIGTNVLLLIEQEDHEKLPPEVYVRGFLRSYAEVIGADKDFTVRSYLESLRIYQRSVQSEHDLKKTEEGFLRRLLLFLSALMGMMILAVLSVYILRGGERRHESIHGLQSASSMMEASPVEREDHDQTGMIQKRRLMDEAFDEPDSLQVSPENGTVKTVEKPSGKWRLKINAVEETRMKVVIDNLIVKEYTLKPGDLLEFEASEGYHIFVENAGGICMTLNDDPLKIQGESGQVVSMQVP